MAYRVNHLDKKTGTIYVYECTSYWDKEKKRPANKQVCIGKLDKDTGEFIPSKRLDKSQIAMNDPVVTVSTQIIGPTLILDKLTSELGLANLLKLCFPNTHSQLLTIAYFLTSTGNALSHCELWCKSHSNPFGDVMISQRISEILKSQTEDERQTFFKKWCNKIAENDCVCYDITSISSYSQLNEYIKYGYNRDKEKLPQINLGMLFGQKSNLPICYKRMPGSITDVVTLKNFIKTLDYLEVSKLHLIMDRGFYSKTNIDELLAYKYKFTIGVTTHSQWIRQILDEYYNNIEMPDNYRKVNDETLYVKTKIYPWGEKRNRIYVHVYYNSYTAAEAFDKFTAELLIYKEEIEQDRKVKQHEAYYQRYFKVKETPKRGRKIDFNIEEIQKHRERYAGFFVLLSNATKEPLEALKIYRNKDVVENCFDDLKNQLDMKRLRIHNSQTMDGRLFVQFIALIYITSIREKIALNKELENYTVRELLEEMETLTKVKYSGRYGSIISEITKKQREILKAFSIEL